MTVASSRPSRSCGLLDFLQLSNGGNLVGKCQVERCIGVKSFGVVDLEK